MKLRVPNFLNRIDLYLLTHYPNVWATRVHYFVFYSLICGNLLMFLLGYLYPISMANIPSYNNIVGIIDLLLLSGFLVIIYWVYLQIRDAKPMFTLKQIVGTFVIYMLCLVSIVINTLVFGRIIEEKIVRLTEKNQLFEDYLYYRSQINLIYKLAINRGNEQKLIELRNSNLSASGSIQRYLDLMNELHALGHPVYRESYSYSSLSEGSIERIEASLLENFKFSAPMKKSVISELQAWNKQSGSELSPKSLVLSDEKILEFFDKYGLQNYSFIKFENKLRGLLSYNNSSYCLARGRYYDFSSLGLTFNIPEREKELLISILELIFSVSLFTLILRNYQRKTIWIALFCSVALFSISLVLWAYFQSTIKFGDEALLAGIHFSIFVICMPILFRAYFLKKNHRITNVILLIPIVYLFLISFLWGGLFYLVGSGSGIDLKWQIQTLGGSLVMSLVYFYPLIKINRLPT